MFKTIAIKLDAFESTLLPGKVEKFPHDHLTRMRMAINPSCANYYSTRDITLERITLILNTAFEQIVSKPQKPEISLNVFKYCRELTHYKSQKVDYKSRKIIFFKEILDEINSELESTPLLKGKLKLDTKNELTTFNDISKFICDVCKNDTSGKLFLKLSDVALKKVFISLLDKNYDSIIEKASAPRPDSKALRGIHINMDKTPENEKLKEILLNSENWKLPGDVELVCELKGKKSQLELDPRQVERLQKFTGEEIGFVVASYFTPSNVDFSSDSYIPKEIKEKNKLVPDWHIDSFSNNPKLFEAEKPVFIVSYFDSKEREGTEYLRLPYIDLGLESVDLTLYIRSIIETVLREPVNASLIEPFIHQTQTGIVAKNLPYSFYHRSPRQQPVPIERTCLVYNLKNEKSMHHFKEFNLPNFDYYPLVNE